MSDLVTRLNAALEGRYRIEQELNEGAIATIYVADDIQNEQRVTLKVLRPEIAAALDADQFLDELETLTALKHPRIVPLLDSGQSDGFLFYVMPDEQERSLSEHLLREKRLSVDRAVRIARAVAETLEFGHKRGFLHLGLEPANVLLLKGGVSISDYGVASAVRVAGGESLTEAGVPLGNPHYMSPVSASGDDLPSAASDIYALGGVFLEMLDGKRHGAVVEEPRPVPDYVRDALERALAEEPRDRFPSAQGFAQALVPGDAKTHEGVKVGEVVAGVVGTGAALGGLAKLASLAKFGALLAKPLAAAAKFGSVLLKPFVVIAKGGGLAIGWFTKALVAARAVAVSPFDDGARLVGRNFDNVFSGIQGARLAARGAFEVADEAAVAAEEMTLVVSSSFNGFFTLFSLVGTLCIAAFVAAMLPLLWRLLVRRRPKIFISFHHSLEPVSDEMGRQLDSKGFKSLRIPFDSEAKHQEVVGRTQEAIRACDAVVCLPGPEDSFVATEVSSATTLQKAIVFAVPESGQVPNTADKRYPMFRLERTRESDFGLLSRFLHYVCADLRSALYLVRESVSSPFVSISWRPLLATASSIGAALFLVCFFQAFGATSALAAEGGVVYAEQRLQIVLSGTLLLVGFATVVFPVAAFTGLASRSYWRQWLGQRRARLKMGNAEFTRDDWVGVVPGLEPGSPLYECLYDTAPRAHHEVAGPAD